MTLVSTRPKRFTAASPVMRYWLANCVGFSLEGGAHGTVERLFGDDDPFVPTQLEIRQGHKRRRLPTSAVLEVVPAEEVLVVRGRERASARHAVLGRAGGAVGVFLLGLATWFARAGRGAVRLVRSVAWQRFGRSVLFA